jgi:hypothetical protein
MGAGTSNLKTATILLAASASRSPLKIDFSNDNAFDPAVAVNVSHQSMRFNSVDLVPDFSFAGAFAGNSPLPDPLADPHITLKPSAKREDRTADIQAAVDKLIARGGGIVGKSFDKTLRATSGLTLA